MACQVVVADSRERTLRGSRDHEDFRHDSDATTLGPNIPLRISSPSLTWELQAPCSQVQARSEVLSSISESLVALKRMPT